MGWTELLSALALYDPVGPWYIERRGLRWYVLQENLLLGGRHVFGRYWLKKNAVAALVFLALEGERVQL